MSFSRVAEKLFDFPRLYRAKFAVTGAAVALLRPLVFKTLVSPADVIRAAAIAPGSRICEIGCGDGENYRMLRDIAGDTIYTGIDINAKMIEHCREVVPEQHWLQAQPPYQFGDRQFDFCLIINVLHHLNGRDDVIAMLAEAGRIAGTIILFEPLQSEHPVLWRLKALYWSLTDGGLSYPRLDEYRIIFEAAGLQLTWERYSSPLRHFYAATLRAKR